MRESPSLPLRLVCALLFLVLLAGSAGAGLTVVRLNQQISRLAANTVEYRNQLDETNRRLLEATVAKAQALQPDSLKARIGNRLVPIQDKQIVWVRQTTTTPPEEAAPARVPSFNFRFAASGPATGSQLTQ